MDEQTEKAPEARTDAQVTNIATAEQLSWQTINTPDVQNVEQNNAHYANYLESLDIVMPTRNGTVFILSFIGCMPHRKGKERRGKSPYSF